MTTGIGMSLNFILEGMYKDRSQNEGGGEMEGIFCKHRTTHLNPIIALIPVETSDLILPALMT